MKNVVAFIILTGLLFVLPFEASAQDYEKILGEWSYNTPQADYGYQTGTITFTSEDDEIKGEVEFVAGYKVDLDKINLKDNKLSFGLYIDYEYYKVEMTLEKKRLTGSVEFSGGKLDITAER
jgi:hypothetical protein